MSSKKDNVKATKLTIGLPFNLGSLELEPDETQQHAAWSLYVELSTRISVHPLGEKEGILREALTSLYNIFGITRQILKDAGPEIGVGPNSFGSLAINVLNVGLRPFVVKWHPKLKSYEEKRPENVTTVDHEQAWEYADVLREELEEVRQQMLVYVAALAKIARVD